MKLREAQKGLQRLAAQGDDSVDIRVIEVGDDVVGELLLDGAAHQVGPAH